jgi:hypothetical protein
MMIMSIIERLLGAILGKKSSNNVQKDTIYAERNEPGIELSEIHSIWDYLQFRENTQAHHLTSVLGFEEWVPMDEIMRRINSVFGIDYKNDRSLYPYIKTLVDCGLLETTDAGGRRKWRKRDLVIKIGQKKQDNQKEAQKIAQNTEKALQKVSVQGAGN